MPSPAPSSDEDKAVHHASVPNKRKSSVRKERLGKAKEKTGAPPTRDALRSTANWWRSLQTIGINLHFLAPPRPPSSNFTISIPSTLADRKGNFALKFYLPKAYESSGPDARWPVVVNYHGGGFTLGQASDDARFARFVVDRAGAIFVSVDYRLAPEHPFPTAVDDGADALLYIVENAQRFRIDVNRVATSGFSAGGNIALTAPLRLDRLRESRDIPEHRIVAIATWYPITDYTLTRAERRANSLKPKQTLSPALTDLFDASYLFPPELNLADPCLSPSKASDELLKRALSPVVIFYTCEWDMLLREGEELARRLEKQPISKKVYYTRIPGVQHGWDKGPNPFKPPRKSHKLYAECCHRLKKAFDEGQSRPGSH